MHYAVNEISVANGEMSVRAIAEHRLEQPNFDGIPATPGPAAFLEPDLAAPSRPADRDLAEAAAN